MSRDRQFLIGMYNATSVGDDQDEIEDYEAWLERQLLRRLEVIEKFDTGLSKSTDDLRERFAKENPGEKITETIRDEDDYMDLWTDEYVLWLEKQCLTPKENS